jgi:hypothetical protein
MNLDHVFIELDLSPGVDEVVNLAIVRTTSKGKVLCTYKTDVEQGPHMQAYVKDRIADVAFTPFPAGVIAISSHAKLYQSLCSETKYGILSALNGKPWFDLTELAWPLRFHDMVSGGDLDTLAKFFELQGNEDVMSRCETLTAVYWQLMQRYGSALKGEAVVRELGGQKLANVRKFLGI